MRGSLLDLFPKWAASSLSAIDLLDRGSIQSASSTETNTNEKIDRISLLPARRVSVDRQVHRALSRRLQETDRRRSQRSLIYRAASVRADALVAIEYYLPLFFEHTATLFDYARATAGCFDRRLGDGRRAISTVSASATNKGATTWAPRCSPARCTWL